MIRFFIIVLLTNHSHSCKKRGFKEALIKLTVGDREQSTRSETAVLFPFRANVYFTASVHLPKSWQCSFRENIRDKICCLLLSLSIQKSVEYFCQPQYYRSIIAVTAFLPHIDFSYCGRLAQMDRALVSGTKGPGFESRIAYQFNNPAASKKGQKAL